MPPQSSPSPSVLFGSAPSSQVIGTDKSGQKKHGRKFHTNQIRPKKCYTHKLWANNPGTSGALKTISEPVKQFAKKNSNKYSRAYPHLRRQKFSLSFSGLCAQVQKHNYKQKKDHDRPCINNHFKGRDKRRAQDKKDQ